MYRAIGVVALLVAQCVPALSRTLGDAPGSPHRTPVLPDDLAVPRGQRHSEAGLSHRHEAKVQTDGSLWARLPPSDRLVQIVPIEQDDDGAAAGRALAYILPPGGDAVERRHHGAPGLLPADDGTEESEQTASTSDTGESDSSDSSSIEDDDTGDDNLHSGRETNTRRENGVNVGRLTKQNVAYVDDVQTDSEDIIHKNINEIVTYLNGHKEVDLNSFIHNVLPIDEQDPDYHVHYIIHKNHRKKGDHASAEGKKSHDHGNNKIQAEYKPKENDVNQKDIHVYSERPAPHHNNTKDEREHHHNHTAAPSDEPGHPNVNLIYPPSENTTHDIDPDHKTILNNDEQLFGDKGNKLSHHTPRRDLEPVLSSGDKIDTSIESTEQHRDSLHERDVGAGQGQLDDTFTVLDRSPETDTNNPIHTDTDGDAHNNDQSDNSQNESDESSSEHYSDSFDDEDISDEVADGSQFIGGSDDILQSEDGGATAVYHADGEDGGRVTEALSDRVTEASSDRVTEAPSDRVTRAPSDLVTGAPSDRVTGAPSDRVTRAPSDLVTGAPSDRVTGAPSGGDDYASAETASPPPPFTFADCLKLKKKASDGCHDTCKGRKSYSLTFSFNG